MNITELIDLLAAKREQHGNLEVELTWEGTEHGIDASNVYASKRGVLCLNADDNFWKDEDAEDPNEGEPADDAT